MAKCEDVVMMIKNRLADYEDQLDCFNLVYESYTFTDAILADVLAVSIGKPSQRNQKDVYTATKNSETVRRWVRNGLLNKEDLQLFMDQHIKYMRDI